MSSEYVIEISNLSKCYQIYDKPSDRLKQMLFRGRRQYFKEFWALKDVSFKVKKGETVGIIGRNGSGKSTLLQMICGTLNPTAGEIKLNCKVAALLELGAGFNPEFTGVENVYMAASLYGLTKEETAKRFDAIAAFADIGEHIYQPVKTYSSGMYVRLAFAVIAHVDANVLVIDEALAVGDAVFTQKCMRFIRKFQETGSLIFVSHDISAVKSLCDKSVWLKDGKTQMIGSTRSVSESYLQSTFQEIYGDNQELKSLDTNSYKDDPASEKKELESIGLIGYESQTLVKDNFKDAKGWMTGCAEITSVSLIKLVPGLEGVYKGGERVRLTIRAKANIPLISPILGFLVRDRLGQDLFGENTLPFTSDKTCSIRKGLSFEGIFEFDLPMLPNGDYSLMVSVADGNIQEHVQHHWLHDAMLINVSSSKIRWGLVGIKFNKVIMQEIINE